jgi:uncharacterized membrane protein (UPF0127 family)
MKHTIIPLDILFVRADGAIAAIAEHTTPYSEAASTATRRRSTWWR